MADEPAEPTPHVAEPTPRVIVVIGVSGSGKSTVGRLLADRLGWDYAEADDFHPPAGIAKMSAGIPLTDADRLPWLRSIAAWIARRLATGTPGVVTCSALKRSYRDLLVDGHPEVRLVFLDGDHDLIAERMTARTGHFFKRALLEGQFADLEPPAPDEHALRVKISGSPDEIVTGIIEAAMD